MGDRGTGDETHQKAGRRVPVKAEQILNLQISFHEFSAGVNSRLKGETKKTETKCQPAHHTMEDNLQEGHQVPKLLRMQLYGIGLGSKDEPSPIVISRLEMVVILTLHHTRTSFLETAMCRELFIVHARKLPVPGLSPLTPKIFCSLL
ncbi:hypothetical protein O6H91_17G064300 [Diphasiastrum complanatum]|uniref:Uncharacterized protein n=1 Tax=Diphasiastrum complanatum TaxID=34168 RepID=A0ACC2B7K3_DIPCM|nr:hypothetical protein O6H91_17G064300 [Diphasiastrum complanatum]